jgi:hypothetical protein
MNDTQIAEDQFELYEAIILSGQVSKEDVPILLSVNPKFENWYRRRAQDRAAKRRF